MPGLASPDTESAKLLEKLIKVYTYDSETGLFYRNYTAGGQKEGSIAGNLRNDKYIGIGLDGKIYLAHRLAWLYMTGELPDRLDHIDENKSNNRWGNLREATRSQNGANRLVDPGKSNVRGIRLVGRKWQTQICVNKKWIYLGSFESKEEASEAYIKARQEYFGDYNPQEMEI